MVAGWGRGETADGCCERKHHGDTTGRPPAEKATKKPASAKHPPCVKRLRVLEYSSTRIAILEYYSSSLANQQQPTTPIVVGAVLCTHEITRRLQQEC